jgi:hypothetical protein
LVLLGLSEVQQIWEESPYKILEWGKQQGAVVGFCHMQYLNDSIQNELNCCIPIDYPVETALGTIDFLSEDVWLNDAAVHAYYKILNCGFRPGWCAGTDYPCNENRPLGSQLTYVQVTGPLTYEKWIRGIKNGRTVVSMNGHSEFLNFTVNGKLSPGDELKIKDGSKIEVKVVWTSVREESGTIELVFNGRVVSSQKGSAGPGKPLVMETEYECTESSWLCARRMNDAGHQTHTAPVYITVNEAPVRASTADALFLANWIDNVINRASPGGDWNRYFTHDLDTVLNRYRKARDMYVKIAAEAELRQN